MQGGKERESARKRRYQGNPYKKIKADRAKEKRKQDINE